MTAPSSIDNEDGGVLRGALDQRQRVLGFLLIDAQRAEHVEDEFAAAGRGVDLFLQGPKARLTATRRASGAEHADHPLKRPR